MSFPDSPAPLIKAPQWHRMITSVFGQVDLKLGDEARFSGSIRHAELAGMELAEVNCAYEDAQRTRRHVAADKRESFVLAMPLSGRPQIEQTGHACEVQPGQFALFALNEPHRYFHDEPAHVLSLKLPCDMLRTRLGRVDDLRATALSAERGAARITFDFLASVLRHAHGRHERADARLRAP